MEYNYNSTIDTSSIDPSAAGGILAVALAFMGIILLIVFIVALFQIIGQWKMFKKANKPGWPAIIPIYNEYVLCTLTGVNPWWILVVLVASTVCGVIPVIGPLLSAAISIYFAVLLCVSTARSYGKEDSWAVGLFLLKPFFMFALGIGKSEYQGPKPMNDIVFEKLGINKKSEQTTTQTPTQTPTPTPEATQQVTQKVCPSCGTQVPEGNKFCTNCGKEV